MVDLKRYVEGVLVKTPGAINRQDWVTMVGPEGTVPA
jgi:hypothetical protein